MSSNRSPTQRAIVIEIGSLSSVAPEIAKWLPAGNALALTSVGSAA